MKMRPQRKITPQMIVLQALATILFGVIQQLMLDVNTTIKRRMELTG
jgi:hypothetical protein